MKPDAEERRKHITYPVDLPDDEPMTAGKRLYWDWIIAGAFFVIGLVLSFI